MHQEISERKRGPVIDFLVIAFMIIMLIGVEIARKQFNGSTLMTIIQLALYLVIVFACLFLYRRRINAYRYTLITENSEDESAYKKGSLLIDSMIGDKGREAEAVLPSEFSALIAPDGSVICGTDSAKPYEKTTNYVLTTKGRKSAHKLVFFRNNVRFFIFFHPTDTLCDLIKKYMVV
ncbi:MAG: hypothetical protein RRY79_03485 [Clostridia bacterium]